MSDFELGYYSRNQNLQQAESMLIKVKNCEKLLDLLEYYIKTKKYNKAENISILLKEICKESTLNKKYKASLQKLIDIYLKQIEIQKAQRIAILDNTTQNLLKIVKAYVAKKQIPKAKEILAKMANHSLKQDKERIKQAQELIKRNSV